MQTIATRNARIATSPRPKFLRCAVSAVCGDKAPCTAWMQARTGGFVFNAMKTFCQLNPPVIGFAITVFIGWGVSLFWNDWWWLTISLALGLIVGDLIEALMPQAASPKTKNQDSKHNRQNPSR